MEFSNSKLTFTLLLLIAAYGVASIYAEYTTCHFKGPCFLKRKSCPAECPQVYPTDPKAKACYMNCNSPICKPECKHRKPNCNTPGAACLDPRFIGGDNIVFYFHGKRNEHFSLMSDHNLQINARFIGVRPAGRARDSTWIQAIGILFDRHSFTLETTKTSKWSDDIDHLQFTHNGQELVIPERHLSSWESSESGIMVVRTSNKNSIQLTIPQIAEISINVVPVTEEDDRIHNYQIPSDDCFAHLEVQFKFYGLSRKVEGVLGRTYQPDFNNPAKPGVEMPVVGGEDKYKTNSLLSSDCTSCIFSPASTLHPLDSVADFASLDCSSSRGYVVCKK